MKDNNASIYVDKELQRVNRDVMEVLENKDIIRNFREPYQIQTPLSF